ncbi:MAG: hypothetical protein HON76_04530 [Candidatus Scalindua sp.]|jgi:hypothetical protein|nr:hypothetical protein [Candidatus Scalindua sp.]MBT5305535.1 hypothetical protein [Candidatus Scalindua sp.]MBT6049846.1 hypothetical protein [Candidatus Scalindua sp.]MBT6228961.1 hypothetical protein [Candidatus Scalindua sp.]MBT6561777.1 hypothetical protein [Candidatus Scalindua sp.]
MIHIDVKCLKVVDLDCHLNKLREDVLFTLNRGGGSMQINESGDDRRHSQRLDLSFEISVLNQKGKTINVCASGVYFEVITDDRGAFAIGEKVKLQIAAVDSSQRKLTLKGEGKIVRQDIKESSRVGSRMCIAAQFTEKLNVALA